MQRGHVRQGVRDAVQDGGAEMNARSILAGLAFVAVWVLANVVGQYGEGLL